MIANSLIEQFHDRLYAQIKHEVARITASGDPDASKDHLVLMTLLTRIKQLDEDYRDWQHYSQDVLSMAIDYKAALKERNSYGFSTIGSAVRYIEEILAEVEAAQEAAKRADSVVSTGWFNRITRWLRGG
ncbi:MAG: hypothetical protein HOC70_09560 [Gammaproteobacteria bacterium]|jgi:hypothetical protein|nr:hypothetical protein [Gammaproteobacteria bacterium]MBT7369605.1 hypothetical protein [Gammaproteobacteria bacterium]